MLDLRSVRHFHMFCGLGGGAKGFNAGEARVGDMVARSECLGGIDVDVRAMRDFNHLAGVPGTVLDFFDSDQYRAFHGHRPPNDWREATRTDIHRAAQNKAPHVVFLSAPCKGFSGLLAEGKSRTDKYQALNRLTVRGVFLMLEAFADDPASLIVFENVPRIATRGRFLLDQIVQLLSHYGYAVAETTHDCGELGGLAQSRKRFLLVARHVERVPPFLYEPPKKPLAAVGSVLGRMPLPGDPAGGPMHRVPSLQWKTWVRLAFVKAGSDWRSLNELAVDDGYLRDYLLVPQYREGSGFLGVRKWDEPTGTVQGESLPTNGAFSVADPRFVQSGKWQDGQAYGVRQWSEASGAITGQKSPGQGAFAVADPRLELKHNNCFRVVRFDRPSTAITAGAGPSAGGVAVADPRPPAGPLFSKYAVTDWSQKTGTVIGGDDSGAYAVADPRPGFGPSTHPNVLGVAWDNHANVVSSESRPTTGRFAVADPRPGWTDRYGNLAVMDWQEPSNTVIAGGKGVQGGWMSIADPRPNMDRGKGDHYLTGGHYGVVRWDGSSFAVSGSACHDNGPWSVADPRLTDHETCTEQPVDESPFSQLPSADQKLIARIISEDGTWHRPFTTLELAALQGLIDPEEQLILDGLSDSAWRERIGNAVPPPSAKAIADEMFRTLLLAWSGETFQLSATPIWVRPVAVALSVAQGAPA